MKATDTISHASPDLATRSRWRQVIKWGLSKGIPAARFMVTGPSHAGISLTFDDGPHPEHTPRLLDLLEQLDIKATFFVIGQNAAEHPDIVFDMAHAGHVVGNHTWSHHEPSQVSGRELLSEVDRTSDLVRELTGQSPTLFRPPKGKLTAAKLIALWRRHLCVVLWNRDPKDFAATQAAEVADRLQQAPITCGDIVLMHDNHPHCRTAIPEYVRRVRGAGLEFETPPMWKGTTTDMHLHDNPLIKHLHNST